jgi:hypothetical protein
MKKITLFIFTIALSSHLFANEAYQAKARYQKATPEGKACIDSRHQKMKSMAKDARQSYLNERKAKIKALPNIERKAAINNPCFE